MTLRYTPAARSDLNEIQNYISQTLKSPVAAKNIITRILKCCGILKEFPFSGAELSSKTGRDTDLRYLICGSHIAFYRVDDQVISVIRILDSRTNYMMIIFDLENE